MNNHQVTQPANPISKWAIRVGAAGLFGGVLIVLGQGGGVASVVGLALPIGIFSAVLGAIVGVIIKAASK